MSSNPYTPHSRHGSVGPAIGALAVVMVLAVIAVVIGRFCSGRKVRQYDFEEWVETKCSSCIDGRLGPPPPPPPPPPVVETTEGDEPPHVEVIHHSLQEA